MNSATNPMRKRVVRFLAMTTLVLISFTLVNAQAKQLSLADLLIGLRSQKVPLPDRNKILTEAVRQRGVTFVNTPEIEKELSTTGADDTLLGAIREKAVAAKPVVEAPKPVATPPPPDYKFYQNRADLFVSKGDLPSAAVDYAKSIEMNGDNAAAYVGRGRAYLGMKSYDLAIVDFDKALSLEASDANAYYNRGLAYEKTGETKKAAADYQKAVELDPSNDVGKASLKRMQDEIAKSMPAPQPVKTAPAVTPEFLNLGNLALNEATKMVTPVYSTVAQRSQVEGRVVVEVELDAEGNVVSAKAISGHQMLRNAAEDAAAKSKFKPALFDGKPIKAKGTITYNFALKATR